MAEEVSGTGYQRRPIKWTTVESPMSVDELVALQEDAEAAAILDALRRFGACPCPHLDCPRRADLLAFYGNDEPFPLLP